MNRWLVLICLFVLAACASSQNSLENEIKSIIRGKDARIGVAIVYDGRDTLAVNSETHYPTMSVFKFPLAMAVLSHLDENDISLDTTLFITSTDLLSDTYSPLRDSFPQGNFNMSVRDLLKYSVSMSDNNACDILFRYVGGPASVQQYIHSLGINDIAITATEEKMHERTENQYLNWVMPVASVELMETFLKKELFAPEYKAYLENLLIATSTGANKIKGLLPEGTVVGHKTGSSSRDKTGRMIADNDLGFVRLPNGKQFTIAVYVMDSMEDDQTNAAIIAEVAKAAYDYYNVK